MYMYFWEIGANIFESALFVIFLNRRHSYRRGIERRKLISVAVFLLLLINILAADQIGVYSSYSFIVDFVIVEIYLTFCMKGNVVEHFLSFILFYLGLFIAATASALVLRLICGGMDCWTDVHHTFRPAILFLAKFLLFCYVLCMLRIHDKFYCNEHRVIKMSYMIVPLVSFTVGLWIIHLIFNFPLVFQVREILLVLLVILLALLSYTLYLSMIAAQEAQKEHEYKSLRNVLNTQKAAMRKMEESQMVIGKLNHDISHRMTAIRFLADNGCFDESVGELEKLHKEICRDAESAASNGDLGQYVVDSKLRKAEEQGIIVVKKISPGCWRKINSIDLSIILGNLLDNAVEAQVQVENKENRSIRFTADENFGCLYITITNTLGKQCEKDKTFLTTKAESEKHGFGLLNVKNLVEQYNGNLKIDMTEDEFKVEVLLPQRI